MTTNEKILATVEAHPWITAPIIAAGPVGLFCVVGTDRTAGMIWTGGTIAWLIGITVAYAWMGRRADQALWARTVAQNKVGEQRRREAARQAQWPSVTRILAWMVASVPALSQGMRIFIDLG